MQKCYYVGIHRWSFRPNEPALILGVRWVDDLQPPRACFHVKYEDDVEVLVPICDYGTYELRGFQDEQAGTS